MQSTDRPRLSRCVTALACAAVLLALNSTAHAAEPRFDSKLVTESTPGHAVKVDVDLAGAKDLYLVVTDGGNGFACDWADWAEPRVVTADGKEVKLTDLKWKSARAGWGQVRIGKNADGGPLKIAGEPVEYGIGTHANSVIHFELPQGARRLKARAGLDNGGTDQGGGTSVRFLVYTEQPPPQVLQASALGGGGGGGDLPPGEAVDAFEVPESLAVGLFASEPMMLSPSNIDIDHRGRVWVCEVVNYREFANKDTPPREEGDRILILEDTDGDARADKSTTFYQGRDVDSAHGVCVLGNKAIVSAGDSVFVLTDSDGDDQADRKDLLFTGISGVQHDHGIHSFLFGPDGKLYFNFGNEGKQIKDKDGQPITDKAGNLVAANRRPYQEGMAFRCNMDGSELETLGWNFRNNWELAVDSFGNIWQSDNDDDGNRGVRINFVMEFGNYGYRDEFTGAGWRDERTGMHEEIPKRHWHLGDPGVVPNLLQTGAGSPTGICVYEGQLLPEPYQGELIHADAGPNVVRCYATEKDGAGFTAEIVPIIDGTNDKWFRPSDVCIAPDGSLIVADWYDPGVGGHRMQDIQKGRLFRVTPAGHEGYKIPTFDFSTPEKAAAALTNPNNEVRYLAWTALHEMGEKAEPALKTMFEEHDNPRMRARALWVLGKIPALSQRYVNAALADENADIRIVGLRLARQLNWDVIPVVEQLVKDPSPAVRRECAIALRHNEHPKAAELWAELAMQHDGKDRWYLEALGIGADGQWDRFFTAWGEQALTVDTEKGYTPAQKDIIWRSRSADAIPLLPMAILHPTTGEKERLRYFRAFDFHRKPEEQPAKANILLGLAASDQPEVSALALKHLADVQGADPGRIRSAVTNALENVDDPQQIVNLVRRFQLEERYPDLLTTAREHPREQIGIEAMRHLLDERQIDLIRKGLTVEDPTQVTALVEALGYSNHGRGTGLLTSLMEDEKQPLAVRRAAVTALARLRPGAEKLLALAKSGKYDATLKDAIAAGLHGAQWQEIKDQASDLFPLPASKDNKPLPPVEQLVNRKGDVQKGRVLFNTTATCVKCHVVNNVGREVGPDLSEIGKKLSRQAMYESILFPSAGISHNYESYSLLLSDGTQATGILVSRTPEEVSLRDTEGITRTYKTSDIEIIKKNEVSLMPADLQKAMTAEDLVNVVEYMTTLTEAKDFSQGKEDAPSGE